MPKPGMMTIKTVKFDFHRFFPCEQPLGRKGRRLHATKQQRVDPSYANDTSLTIEIQQAKPTISARFDGFPDTMYVGEQVGGMLEIRNEGKTAFGGVQLCLNEPGSISLVTGKFVTLFCADIIGTERQSSSIVNSISGPQFLHVYTETIPPGETISVPISFTLFRPGRIDIRGILIAADANSEDLAITTLSHTIDCQPLISITTATQPSRRHLGQHLIDVEVSNSANTSVQLDSIAAISPFWDATLPDL